MAPMMAAPAVPIAIAAIAAGHQATPYFDCQNSEPVGPKPKEGGLAQRIETGEAHQQIEAHRLNRVDQGENRNGEPVTWE